MVRRRGGSRRGERRTDERIGNVVNGAKKKGASIRYLSSAVNILYHNENMTITLVALLDPAFSSIVRPNFRVKTLRHDCSTTIRPLLVSPQGPGTAGSVRRAHA